MSAGRPRHPRRAVPAMPEKQWEAQVVGLARFYGWTGWHHADSRRQIIRRGVPQWIGDPDARGFPDWVFVRGVELLFVELKGERTRVAPEQDAALDALGTVARAVGAACKLAEAWAQAANRVEVAGELELLELLNDAGELELPAVEVHLWRAPDLEPVHARLARGRRRQEPIA